MSDSRTTSLSEEDGILLVNVLDRGCVPLDLAEVHGDLLGTILTLELANDGP